jgi:hypothetical protein
VTLIGNGDVNTIRFARFQVGLLRARRPFGALIFKSIGSLRRAPFCLGLGPPQPVGVRVCLFLMSLFKFAGIKSATVALAMILVGGWAFAAETPIPERPTGGPASERPPVIDEDKAEAFWENLIESEKANNEQLAADASVPP